MFASTTSTTICVRFLSFSLGSMPSFFSGRMRAPLANLANLLARSPPTGTWYRRESQSSSIFWPCTVKRPPVRRNCRFPEKRNSESESPNHPDRTTATFATLSVSPTDCLVVLVCTRNKPVACVPVLLYSVHTVG